MKQPQTEGIGKVLYDAGIPRSFHEAKIEDIGNQDTKVFLTNYKTAPTREVGKTGFLVTATMQVGYLFAKIALVTNREALCLPMSEWRKSFKAKEFAELDMLVITDVEPYQHLPMDSADIFTLCAQLRWLRSDGVDVVLAADGKVDDVTYLTPAMSKEVKIARHLV